MNRYTFLNTILLGSLSSVLGKNKLQNYTKTTSDILVRMIYNNIGTQPDFKCEWGLSIWIEKNREAVLFDTGGDFKVLEKNVKAAGLDIQKLKAIVISHNHWDHINALPIVLDKIPSDVPVYVPLAVSDAIRDKYDGVNIVAVDKPVQIKEYIWSTGQFIGSYKTSIIPEQAILVDSKNKLYLFTGCSHPGIVEMIESVCKKYPDKIIALVAGGFHLLKHSEKDIRQISLKLKKLNIENLAASHCTGDQAIQIFKEEWGNRYINFYTGDYFKV